MNNPLARLTKKEISNTRNERRDVTINLIDIKRIIKKYYEQLCAYVFDNR